MRRLYYCQLGLGNTCIDSCASGDHSAWGGAGGGGHLEDRGGEQFYSISQFYMII